MKYRCLLILCAFLLVRFQAGAEDPNPGPHWYQITVTDEHSTRSFTGASEFDSEALDGAIKENTSILLENLRSWGATADDKQEKWRAVNEGCKLHIISTTIVYYLELPGDPLNGKPVPAK